MNIKDLKTSYIKAKEAYYNSDPIMSDAKFDALEDKIRALDPKWEELNKTGVKVKKTEVALLHPMPSLNKAYPEHLVKWLAKMKDKHYTIMQKLDGSSLQVAYSNGKPVSVVTRGDGMRGGDISFLIPHLNLPKIEHKADFVMRCEALIQKKKFNKWKEEFDNGRNMINGLLNRKTPHPALKDVDIVALGIFDMPLKAGLMLLDRHGIKTVPRFVASIDSPDTAIAYLQTAKLESSYEIDGLVIAPSAFVLHYENSDKPKSIIAFKVNEDASAKEVKVKKIIWQVSGRGRIIPKIEIEPTEMDGVIVTYCTSHNAKWMMDRGIGPGAIVKVLRSGGVIPKIVDVIKKGKYQAPDIGYSLEGVHYVVKGQQNDKTSRTIVVKNLHKFCTTMGIELLGQKTLASLYDVGVTSALDIIGPDITDFMNSADLGPKQISNIEQELLRVLGNPIPLSKLMVASQCFGVGIGERKLKQIEDAGISMGKLLLHWDKHNELWTLLHKVDGFSNKTVRVMELGMPDFDDFYSIAASLIDVDETLPEVKIKKSTGSLVGQNVSFTGYRDKNHEAWVEAQGGSIVSFGAKTNILLYKADGKESTKVDKARSKGIKVLTFDELKG